MHRLICLLYLACLPVFLCAQIEKVYDENEHLRTVNPISEEGIYEGTGYTWHPNGAIAKETPYAEGFIHGTEKGYFPDGSLQFTQLYRYGDRVGKYLEFHVNGLLKVSQQWEQGERAGETIVYNEAGDYRMYGLYAGDSLLFAQYFDDEGNLTRELFHGIDAPLDTSLWEDPRIFALEAGPLKSGQANACRIVIPRVPSAFIRYSCPDGIISYNPAGGQYPLLITPNKGLDSCRLYLRIQTHDEGGAALMRRMTLALHQP